jgi:hypothetical protein
VLSLRFTLGVSEEKLIRHDNFKRRCEEADLNARKLAARFKDGQEGDLKGGYSYWQGLLNGTRPFGEKIARKLEDALGWPRYSLDETPSKMPEGYVRLDARERAMIESYRAISKEARQLDFELDQFGERRAEAYQALLVRVEELRAKLLLTAPAPSPSAPSAAKPKTRPVRTR